MADTIWTVTDTAVATDDTTSSNTLSPLGTDDVSNGPNSYVANTDTFAGRTVSGGWGTSSDGRNTWNNTNANFSVSGNEGRVLNDSTFPTAILIPTFAPTAANFLDADLLARFTFGNTGDEFLPVVRNATINGLANVIGLNIQNTFWFMEINKNGHKFSTPTVSFTCTPGTFYWTRLQAIGNIVRGKVWVDGSGEPGTWGLSYIVNDNMNSGSNGLKFKSVDTVNPVKVDSVVLMQLGGPTLDTLTPSIQFTGTDSITTLGETNSTVLQAVPVDTLTINDSATSFGEALTLTDDISSNTGTLAGTDTFAGRTVSGGWGTSSDGLTTWQPTQANYSVSGNEGQIVNQPSSPSMYFGTALYADADILFRFTLGASSDVMYGKMRQDGSNAYSVSFQVTATTVGFTNKQNNTFRNNIGSVAFTCTPGTFYWIRARVIGRVLSGKVWADGSSEPGPWTIQMFVDGIMGSGQFGVKTAANSLTVPCQVDSFILTNLGGPPPDSLIQSVPLTNTDSLTQLGETSSFVLNAALSDSGDSLSCGETPAYAPALTRTHSVTLQETSAYVLSAAMADSGDTLTCGETPAYALALTISDSLTLFETSTIAYGFTESLTTLAETSSYALNYAGIDTPTLGDSMSVSPTTLFTDDVSGGTNSYVALTDTFAGRTVSGGWGTTSDGKGFYTSTNANFSVSGNEGQVLNDVTFPTGFLAPSFAPTTNLFLDVDLLVRFTLGSTTDAFFPVLRNLTINSLANLANLNIQNTFYVMEINKNGHKFVSPNVSFTCTPGTFYWVRFQAVGNIVRGRVWADGSGEPGTWGVTSIINDNMNSGSTGLKFKSASAVNPVKVDSLVLTQLGGPTLDVLSPALQLSGTDQLTVSETFVPAQNIAVTDQLTVQETGSLLSFLKPIDDVPLVVSDVSVLALAVTRTDTLTLSETSGSTLLFVPLDALSATEISGQQKTYVMQLGGVIILTSNFIFINTVFTDSLVPSEPSIVLLAAHIGTDTLSIIEAVSMYPELYIIILQVMRTGIVTQHI